MAREHGRARKVLDLQRDQRSAPHSGSVDPDEGWTGHAKLARRAELITDPERVAAIIGGRALFPSHLFRTDIAELSVVRLGEPVDHPVIEAWHAGRGVSRRERR